MYFLSEFPKTNRQISATLDAIEDHKQELLAAMTVVQPGPGALSQ
jgi:hypothetical protein